MKTIACEIRPVIKIKGGSYTDVYTYHNVWENGESCTTSRETVGRLIDGDKVKFG